VGRTDGHGRGDPTTATGESRWPPTGRFAWPPSARIHGLPALLSDNSFSEVFSDHLRIAQLGTWLGTRFSNGSSAARPCERSSSTPPRAVVPSCGSRGSPHLDTGARARSSGFGPPPATRTLELAASVADGFRDHRVPNARRRPDEPDVPRGDRRREREARPRRTR